MKYKIEKNTVQETLVIPLYSRKLCTELYPNLFPEILFSQLRGSSSGFPFVPFPTPPDIPAVHTAGIL